MKIKLFSLFVPISNAIQVEVRKLVFDKIDLPHT